MQAILLQGHILGVTLDDNPWPYTKSHFRWRSWSKISRNNLRQIESLYWALLQKKIKKKLKYIKCVERHIVQFQGPIGKNVRIFKRIRLTFYFYFIASWGYYWCCWKALGESDFKDLFHNFRAIVWWLLIWVDFVDWNSKKLQKLGSHLGQMA